MTTSPETLSDQALPDQESTAPEQTNPTLLAAVQQWLQSLRVVVARAIDITVLEARLAALNFVLILIIAVASGLLLATAWIAFFGAVVAWFHELGLSWSAALLSMAAINLVLAIVGGFTIYRMSNNLLFKAIRKFILYEEGEHVSAEPAAGESPAAP
ncbi:MAG TPA: hypothetical protein VGK97_05025 [Spongiibacteraceae bacterium]